jgi:hypothetical protein
LTELVLLVIGVKVCVVSNHNLVLIVTSTRQQCLKKVAQVLVSGRLIHLITEEQVLVLDISAEGCQMDQLSK